MPVLEASRDEVTATTTFLVDDHDDRRGAGPPGIRVRGCRAIDLDDISKAEIRRAFNSNIGAFGACYRDALRRVPGVAGDLAIRAVFGPTSIDDVTVEGPGDAAFHACVASATRALWITPRPHAGATEVNYHFKLGPDQHQVPAGSPPEAYFTVEDYPRALAAWGELLARPLDGAAGCRARAGVVRAFAQLAPWLDDARVLAATRDLMRHAAAIDPAEAAACLEGVQPLLLDIAGRRVLPAWSALHRIETVLPARHLLADQHRFRVVYGDQLIAHERHDLARLELEAIVNDPKLESESPRVEATRRLQELRSERPLEPACGRW
jgi:hypothetical protein